MESGQAGRRGESDGGVVRDAHARAPRPAEGAGSHADDSAPAAGPPAPPSHKNPNPLTRWLPLVLLLCGAAAAYFVYDRNKRELLGGLKTGAEQVREILTGGPPADPYAEAVSKIEADRGEATGRRVQVEIPAELRQYREARRFLAIQGAAAAAAGVKSPHDFAELAETIRAGGELVEVPRLGRGFVLYGVGLTATGALTHYDTKNRKVVPLFADAAELKAYEDGLAAERERLTSELKDLEGRAKQLARGERAERARLLAEAAAKRKDLTSAADREKLVAAYYGRPGAKEREKAGERLFAEYAAQAALARDFGGRSYDLRDPASSREFQARVLSHVRPAALAVLEELGTAYEAKFGRPLPVTSLVRTEEYQRLLRESGNPNAADVAPPPHTTGLAFDVYYRYMTAAEQEFVMAEIARLESAGRVEALRELRDHYHVFVFAEGRRPDDEEVDAVLGRRARPQQPKQPEQAAKKTAKKEKPQPREKRPRAAERKGRRR